MIPNLPRPLLWSEIKTKGKFLHGDSLIEKFYKILNEKGVPSVGEVTFLNELYYQLTRYYYEKPERKDCLRYYEDIRSNLGKVELADLVMTMMYHYCRLKSNRLEFSMSTFMAEVRIEQESNSYWQKFSCIKSHARRWQKDILSPDNPCPVPPVKLDGEKIDWKTITQNYDYMFVKEIVGLWHGDNDKKDIASILMMYLNSDNPQISIISGLHQTKQFLIKVMNGQDNNQEDNKPSEDKEFEKATKEISEYNMKKELEEKDKKIAQLKKELKELKEQHEVEKTKILNDQTLQNEAIYEEIEDAYKVTKEGNEFTRQTIDGIYRQIDKEKRLRDKFEKRIKELQDKLGEETVPLSVLAEGLKDYVDEAGFDETHKLFNHLNNLLIGVSAWTKNVPSLKKFFKDARKGNKQPTLALTNEKGGIVQISDAK